MPLPGYTHMQKAMPTSVGVWLGSFAAGFEDSLKLVDAAIGVLDQNPLGSAAGFGLAQSIDRQVTTEALGFSKTQENVMYCGLSRGLFDTVALQSLTMPVVLAGRFARDMLLYTTQEFAYLYLPDEFLTGSSIMPQKKNYDLFEIMRGNVAVFNAYVDTLRSVSSSISSGYQRDLQLLKQNLISGFDLAAATFDVLIETVPKLAANSERLQEAITDEMHSADKANALAVQGVPFRDAYRQIKSDFMAD